MTKTDPNIDRRQYPRYRAPIGYRSAPLFSTRKPLVDVGLGGIRIYSDDKFKIGKRLEIELFLPDEESLTFTAKVVWQNPLPEDVDAKYDVGLQFLSVPEDKLQRLQEVLEKYKDTEE